jgi:hypothetical protein
VYYNLRKRTALGNLSLQVVLLRSWSDLDWTVSTPTPSVVMIERKLSQPTDSVLVTVSFQLGMITYATNAGKVHPQPWWYQCKHVVLEYSILLTTALRNRTE